LLTTIQQFAFRQQRRVLAFDPDAVLRDTLSDLAGGGDVTVTTAATGAEAIEALRGAAFDCVILAGQPSDMSLAALAERLTANESTTCPILLYEQGETNGESPRWKRLAHEFRLRHVDSPARLVDETAAALCQPFAGLPEPRQALIRELHQPAAALAGKKILIVDDDIRNIFALTSILERFDVNTLSAETGRDAIEILQSSDNIDIVLMDIMMPEMDGIDTMRAIRQIPRLKNLPIVAVTAKAMKGDREKCIDAGAWDYLSKPVDPDKMLAVLRAWLTD
jgi:CheY-like chemotaxis protein